MVLFIMIVSFSIFTTHGRVLRVIPEHVRSPPKLARNFTLKPGFFEPEFDNAGQKRFQVIRISEPHSHHDSYMDTSLRKNFRLRTKSENKYTLQNAIKSPRASKIYGWTDLMK